MTTQTQTYGMMWLDTSPKKSLGDKIKEGKEYFEEKYGLGMLEFCHVNRNVETESGKVFHGLTVMVDRDILNNHYYFVVKSEFSQRKLNPIRKGEK